MQAIAENGTVTCQTDDDSGAAEVNALKTQLGTKDGAPNQASDPVSFNKVKDVPADVVSRNADTLDGRNSSFYLPGGNLPSVSTIRGVFAEADNAQAANHSQYAVISFGYSISFTPTLHYVASGASTPTGCIGNAANPGAQPGHLCIFETGSFNLNSHNPFMVENSGAAVALSLVTANTFYAYGTWAVTAP